MVLVLVVVLVQVSGVSGTSTSTSASRGTVEEEASAGVVRRDPYYTILYRQGDATTTTTGDATSGDATSGGEECAAVGSVRVIAGELEGVRGPAQVTTRASVTMSALVSTTGTTAPTSTTLLRLSCHCDTNPAQTFTPILLWDATLAAQGAVVELPVHPHVTHTERPCPRAERTRRSVSGRAGHHTTAVVYANVAVPLARCTAASPSARPAWAPQRSRGASPEASPKQPRRAWPR